MKHSLLIAAGLMLLIAGCAPARLIHSKINRSSKSLQYHAGFVLYDPSVQRTLLEINGDKFFTPASNTKVFTLLACAETLSDTVPGLQFRIAGDSLIFRGTGDPSFLNPETWSGKSVWSILKTFPGQLYFDESGVQPEPYGPGWMWDDYDAYFQAEKSAFPIYGNSLQMRLSKNRLVVSPSAFRDSVRISDDSVVSFRRELYRNRFTYQRSDSLKRTVPILRIAAHTRWLLADTLDRTVAVYPGNNHFYQNVIPGVPADSLYKTLMQESDNFIAEQLLMMAGRSLSDSLNGSAAVRYVLKKYFPSGRPPIWVDGSGLSRYNQITPLHMISAWVALHRNIPPERLYPLLTQNKSLPFVHAKSGSMSNVWCLSGSIITKSGKTLFFSSMNANFTCPSRIIRSEIETILNLIHERY